MSPFRSLPSRRLFIALIGFAIIVGLIGCLEMPLGDPEKSKVDNQYVGLWLQKNAGNDNNDLISVIPYDARTYVVTDMSFSRDPQQRPQPKSEMIYKMWLTDINGATFATLEPKDPATLLPNAGKFYEVLKISRQGNTITAQDISEQFVKDANITTPQALEKLITENFQNPALYGNTATFDLLAPGQTDDAKSILSAFNHDK